MGHGFISIPWTDGCGGRSVGTIGRWGRTPMKFFLRPFHVFDVHHHRFVCPFESFSCTVDCRPFPSWVGWYPTSSSHFITLSDGWTSLSPWLHHLSGLEWVARRHPPRTVFDGCPFRRFLFDGIPVGSKEQRKRGGREGRRPTGVRSTPTVAADQPRSEAASYAASRVKAQSFPGKRKAAVHLGRP